MRSKRTLSELDPNDAWVFLLSTVRYSLGRSTYMTSLSTELVVKYKDHLNTDQLKQIAKEIREELERYDRVGKVLPDANVWRTGAVNILKCIEERNKDA